MRRERRRAPSLQAFRQGTLPASCRRDGPALIFRLPRRLHSPNTWGVDGLSWRKSAARGAFRVLLATAYAELSGAVLTVRPMQERRRMRAAVESLLSSSRKFIKDADNLRFSTKPLNDALTDLGLIRDDSQAWLEQDMPTQRVSDDGFDWTIVTLSPLEEGTRG